MRALRTPIPALTERAAAKAILGKLYEIMSQLRAGEMSPGLGYYRAYVFGFSF
jgi:hypothetical protein